MKKKSRIRTAFKISVGVAAMLVVSCSTEALGYLELRNQTNETCTNVTRRNSSILKPLLQTKNRVMKQNFSPANISISKLSIEGTVPRMRSLSIANVSAK